MASHWHLTSPKKDASPYDVWLCNEQPRVFFGNRMAGETTTRRQGPCGHYDNHDHDYYYNHDHDHYNHDHDHYSHISRPGGAGSQS